MLKKILLVSSFLCFLIVVYSCSKSTACNPGAISGPSSIFVGNTTTLTETVSGGTWTSSNTAVATVGATGIVTGVATGNASITYATANGCAAITTHNVTVNCLLPVTGTISGATSMDVGYTATLTETVNGGNWSSNNTAIAKVNEWGVVTGVAKGSATITYTMTNLCGAATATYPITVDCPFPIAGTISGDSSVYKGNTTTLTETVSGGYWSSSNTAIATVNELGVVTGVGTGRATIIFTTTNICGTATATYPITISSTLIGTSSGGGIIAYFLQPGDPGYSTTVQHGFIAAPTDQSTGIHWYNGSYITTGATGTAIGTGLANTNAIIAAQGAGSYAAALCRNLTLGGFTDWYLPSKDELSKLYLNKSLIGGFAAAGYWSSSEYDTNDAWFENFVSGFQGGDVKYDHVGYVRAIRAF